MCTVSFIKSNQNVIITSNRDENINRALALPPKMFVQSGKKMFFPQDPDAKGTWFCVSEQGECLVLLNGANEKHIPKPPYKKSRGLIVVDLMQEKNVLKAWQEINLYNIEPFTLVYFSVNRLHQLQWNGIKKT